jgi:hypothetical protein
MHLESVKLPVFTARTGFVCCNKDGALHFLVASIFFANSERFNGA